MRFKAVFSPLWLSILIILLTVSKPNLAFASAPLCADLFGRFKGVSDQSTKSTAYIEGAEFADLWVNKRMKGAQKVADVDQRVMDVWYFASQNNLHGFRVVGVGAGSFFITRSKLEELHRILTDQDFANGFTDRFVQYTQRRKNLRGHFSLFEKGEAKKPIDVNLFQQATRIFFAYQYIMTLPRNEKSYSLAEFNKLAQIEGLKVENFNKLYRIDARDPQEIINDDGFYPNPGKPKGILTEHSRQGWGAHGAGFVSTSSQVGNTHNLKVWPIVQAAKIHSTDANVASQIFQSPADTLIPTQEKYHLEVLKTNEYFITEAVGIKPNKNTSIIEEKEIVAPFVQLSRIQKVRTIYILVEVKRDYNGSIDDFKYKDSRFIEWTDLN